jgi:hypothetical protein
MDPDAGLPSLPPASVTHVITDPPYEAEAHTLQRRIKKHHGGGIYGVDDSPLVFDAMTPELRVTVGAAIGRITRRWVLVFCQVEAVTAWRDALTSDGSLKYKRACIWVKPDGQPQLTGDRPGMGYESIVTAHAPGRSRWNAGGRVGVYYAMRNQDHGPRHLRHQTVKPMPLMESLIRDFTDPGDLIVDPFTGSGSTGVAAVRLGRRFIGWEVDEHFHAHAMRRLTDAREQPELTSIEAFERAATVKRQQTTLLVDPVPPPGPIGEVSAWLDSLGAPDDDD